MLNTDNPLRPRSDTLVKRIDRKVFYGFVGIFAMLFVMFGLNIASIQLTKDLQASRGKYLTGVGDHVPLATHQAAQVVDFDQVIDTPMESHDLDGMNAIILDTPTGKSSYAIESWEVTGFDTFSVRTVGNHSLDFNGTALSWDDQVVYELECPPAPMCTMAVELCQDGAVPEPQYNDQGCVTGCPACPRGRRLSGWRERLARKVKKKLDSPMCNTEALVDRVTGRKLEFAMAPACHVGVSGAKIYMHYTS